MEENIGHNNENTNSSCSPFWVASTFLSFFNGLVGRKKQLASAEDELNFQKELTLMREKHENTKEILEVEFKRHLKEQQRENENIQTEFKFNLELEKDELKMFVKGWPLKLSLQKVQKKRENIETLPPNILIIIAKHTGGKNNDILSNIYDGASGIVDKVQTELKEMDIPDSDVLRYKNNEQILGGASLANIYTMLSAFPTVVILPRIDQINKRLNISVGCWFTHSRIPSQYRVFTLDYDENKMSNSQQYKEEKQKEIEYCYIAIAGVMNDVYSLLVNDKTPKFPSYALSQGLFTQYPKIKDHVVAEFSSILDKKQTSVILNGVECDTIDILFNEARKQSIENKIKGIFKLLN